jgi:hypothetical protein
MSEPGFCGYYYEVEWPATWLDLRAEVVRLSAEVKQLRAEITALKRRGDGGHA